ncbi:ABC transporter ATP-binding protein [Serpentinicella sp. ANB-PHB4]|uniref:ABC transporter ATP-binding protein n=1 Tax=Serpentinicella sp. ANB-PHB4 TaxID=3074076 RepID=UPI002859A831|nr:ABC transporter ATP-binding protein [Serpentinicella sp. ANB-PHB4]MDR5658438.1 ABC transporter ATP-binding protein [Serpentinicella sp. ANB-PHB4]
MISVRNLTKKYEGFEAIDSVDLSVKKGSIYGLLGSNGAGKTTLLKTLVGLYKPNTGEVLIDEQPVFENIALKERVIFISDRLYFFSSYTIEDMAKFYKSIYPKWNEQRYRNLKQVFKIDFNRKINRLSKGMMRQVAIWLALSAMPEVLILDEPLDGLDSVMRQKVKNLLFQDVAERSLTIIISSHNLRELEDLCDHVGILHQGKMIVEKDMDDLKKDVHKVQVAFKEEVKPQALEELEVLHKETKGSIQVYIVRGEREGIMHHFSKLNPAVLDVLPLSLEEVFIYEMGDTGYEIDHIIFQ